MRGVKTTESNPRGADSVCHPFLAAVARASFAFVFRSLASATHVESLSRLPPVMAIPRNDDIHPFLKGNFAPVTEEFISHPCQIIHGEIPPELLGGQYIRNGGNPVHPPDKGRPYHW